MAETTKKKMAIIASKGTLDMAYPPLILASTAAAMDVEVQIFFTLYGVNIQTGSLRVTGSVAIIRQVA